MYPVCVSSQCPKSTIWLGCCPKITIWLGRQSGKFEPWKAKESGKWDAKCGTLFRKGGKFCWHQCKFSITALLLFLLHSLMPNGSCESEKFTLKFLSECGKLFIIEVSSPSQINKFWDTVILAIPSLPITSPYLAFLSCCMCSRMGFSSCRLWSSDTARAAACFSSVSW